MSAEEEKDCREAGLHHAKDLAALIPARPSAYEVTWRAIANHCRKRWPDGERFMLGSDRPWTRLLPLLGSHHHWMCLASPRLGINDWTMYIAAERKSVPSPG